MDLSQGLSEAIDQIAVESTSGREFLVRHWFDAAKEAYNHSTLVTLVGRRRGGSPIMAIPLVSMGPRFIGAKTIPGSYWPFRSFPVAEDISEHEVIDFLKSASTRRVLGPAWRLGPIYESDPAAVLFLSAARKSGWHVITRPLGMNFVLDLAGLRSQGPWPRKSTLKKIRYSEKQLSAHGELRWDFVRGRRWSSTVLEDLATIEARSWVGTRTDRSTSKFLAPTHRRFWERMVLDPETSEHVSAALLYVGDSPVAFSLDIDCRTVKYVIANSYDADYSKHSPGKLLAYRNIADAIDRGVHFVDWGTGDSGYKQTFGAYEGPAIIDCLFLRGKYLGRLLSHVLGAYWRRST